MRVPPIPQRSGTTIADVDEGQVFAITEGPHAGRLFMLEDRNDDDGVPHAVLLESGGVWALGLKTPVVIYPNARVDLGEPAEKVVEAEKPKRRVRVDDDEIHGTSGVVLGSRGGDILVLLDQPRPYPWNSMPRGAQELGATDDMLPRLTWALEGWLTDLPSTGGAA